MFKDEILEMIFSESEMQKIPIGTQATAVSVFENVIGKIRKENPVFLGINTKNINHRQDD